MLQKILTNMRIIISKNNQRMVQNKETKAQIKKQVQSHRISNW